MQTEQGGSASAISGREKIAGALISCGGGRLHFIETANALWDAGVPVSLLVGLLPHRRLRWAYDLGGRLFGRRGLAEGLAVRVSRATFPRERIHSLALAESAIYVAMLLSRYRLCPEGHGQAVMWRFFGYSSRRFLGREAIFHVRSGAGQGGAIRRARQLGMKVVVDHSIAHPAYIRRVMAATGGPVSISENDPFWKVVLKDCEEADVLLVNSEFVKSTFVERGFPPEKISVAYLGVRDDFLSLKKQYRLSPVPRLLFTGAFSRRKGADLLVRVLRCLEDRGLVCELNVLGDASECGALARDYQGRSKIVTHGPVPQQELKKFLADSDLYVFPTLAEGCAKSAMEAMAAGLPVLTTRACGLPGENGRHLVQCEERTAEAWANSMETLLRQTGDRRREGIGRDGARLVNDRYRWQHYGQALASLYRNLLK